MNTIKSGVMLLLDSNRGIYIPQKFAENFVIGANGWQGISEQKKEILLAGPNVGGSDHPSEIENGITEANAICDYWETWDDVLSNAYYEKDGHKWTLYQDGDLWAICHELMTDEEKHNFGMGD